MISRKIIILIIILIITGFIRIGFTEEVHISSSAIFLQGKPGQTFTGFFSLTYTPEKIDGKTVSRKRDKEEVHLETSIKTWFILDENRDIPLHSWVRISPRDILLKPEESKKVTYHVTVPPDAQGYLMAMVTFETLPPEPEGEEAEKKVEEETEIIEEEATDKKETEEEEEKEEEEKIMIYSIPVYILVEGTIKTECSVTRIDISREEDTLLGTLELENTGNVFLRPEHIEMRIQDTEGNEIALLSNEEKVLPIFPKKKAVYNISGKTDEIQKGEYTLSVFIKGENPPFEYLQECLLHVNRDGTLTIYTAEKK